MSQMVRQEILPAVSAYAASLAEAVAAKRAVYAQLPCKAETGLIQSLSTLMDSAFEKVESLDTCLANGKIHSDNTLAVATYYKDTIIPAMAALRAVVDEMAAVPYTHLDVYKRQSYAFVFSKAGHPTAAETNA